MLEVTGHLLIIEFFCQNSLIATKMKTKEAGNGPLKTMYHDKHLGNPRNRPMRGLTIF